MARKTRRIRQAVNDELSKFDPIVINNRFYGVYAKGMWHRKSGDKLIGWGTPTTLLLYAKEFKVHWFPFTLKNGRILLLPELAGDKLVWVHG